MYASRMTPEHRYLPHKILGVKYNYLAGGTICGKPSFSWLSHGVKNHSLHEPNNPNPNSI